MKVMCIKDTRWYEPDNKRYCDGPAYMEICEALGSIIHNDDLYYELKGYSMRKEEVYHSKYFIPLSDISETEMQRDYSTIKTLTP